jgi:hypothetical protein
MFNKKCLIEKLFFMKPVRKSFFSTSIIFFRKYLVNVNVNPEGLTPPDCYEILSCSLWGVIVSISAP